jgi:hypothetical protein
LEIFSDSFDKDLFVSVVSIPVQNTKTNQNKPEKMFFGFAKQTEKQTKQIEFHFVWVRTEKNSLFRGHTTGDDLWSVQDFACASILPTGTNQNHCSAER